MIPHNRCTLAGCYEISFSATVTFDGGLKRRFEVLRVRRYDASQLASELAELGWRRIYSAAYGPAPEHMALLLLQRQ